MPRFQERQVNCLRGRPMEVISTAVGHAYQRWLLQPATRTPIAHLQHHAKLSPCYWSFTCHNGHNQASSSATHEVNCHGSRRDGQTGRRGRPMEVISSAIGHVYQRWSLQPTTFACALYTYSTMQSRHRATGHLRVITAITKPPAAPLTW